MALDIDDLEPGKPRQKAALKNLDPLSVTELEDYIATLQTEIERARTMITQKNAARAGADSFFKR